VTVAALLATAAAVAALAAPPGQLTLDRAAASPNARVTVRSSLANPARLYLVPPGTGPVLTRDDGRLRFIGAIRAHGSLTFSVPPLAPGLYRLVFWCSSCRLTTTATRLRIRPSPSCPVTRPNGRRPAGEPASPHWHGNGLLWASLETDGVYEVARGDVGADGSIGNKLGWATTPATAYPRISGQRIDGTAPPLRVKSVNLGQSSNSTRPSFASAVAFPSAGCWRLTARVGDVSLVYVVRVDVAG
jgi:hypothetical protein